MKNEKISVETLSEEQLKSQLKSYDKRYLKPAKQYMAPLLYHLRSKLKMQGSRTGKGFGAWVDANLSITRRTADLWANDWAKKNGLLELFLEVPEPRVQDDLYSLQFSLSPEDLEKLLKAVDDIGIERVPGLVYDFLLNASNNKSHSTAA